MKTISYLMLFVLVCTTSCQDSNEMEIASVHDFKKLEKTTLLQGTMELPIGTLWKYADADESEIQFKLPEGYLFLVYDNVTGKSVFSIDAGYSCTCTKSSQRCKTFEAGDLGFGCLRGSCSGTCEGEDAKSIVGIVQGDLENNLYALNTKASLSPGALFVFFNNEIIKESINQYYALVYYNSDLPNFPTENNLGDYDKEKFIFAKTKLMGVDVSFFIPKRLSDNEVENAFEVKSGIFEVSAKPTCTCSGDGSSCKVSSFPTLALGTVYSCEGCSTCTMRK